ncbi:MAG: hypothetical protein J7494_01215 [Sphingobium sp.]|nr:hypothetical protein [Sphingobium sp.]
MTDAHACSGRRTLVLIAGLIVASGVPAGLFAFATSLRGAYVFAFFIFGTFATLFGLPTYLALREYNKDGLLSATTAGFFIGGGPMLVFGLPVLADPYQGLLSFLSLAAGMAALGVAGAATFWLIVVFPEPHRSGEEPPAPSWNRTLLSCIAAAGPIGVCFLTF